MLLSYDTETFLIRPGRQAPPPVCASYAHDSGYEPGWHSDPNQSRQGVETVGLQKISTGVLHHTQILALVEHALNNKSVTLVTANGPYDMAVCAARWPHLLPAIFAAYEDGRIRDVLIRQKLLDIAAGCYGGYFDNGGKWVQFGYSLGALASRILAMTLDKGADSWRLRYGELYDVPFDEWPEPAIEYPRKDAVAPLLIYDEQEPFRERGWLDDENRQCAASWPLQLMNVYGVRTDPERVAKLIRETTETAGRLRKSLIAGGLVRTETGPRSGKTKITRNTKAAKARMVSIMGAKGLPVKSTASGDVALDEEACEATEDRLLIQYAEYTSLGTVLSKDIPVLLAGTKIPIQPHYEVLRETGRTAASGDARGDAAVGYNVQNMRRATEPRCPACFKKNSANATKCKKCDLPMVPVTGIRECFVPRPGFYYADCDYDGVELRAFSQVCILTVGFSRMAERLNAGMDVHLDVAAQLASVSYEFALEASKGLHGPEMRTLIKDNRQLAKALNFGLPGGLSASGRDGNGGFRAFARGYGLHLSRERCEELKQAWFATWPEASAYFRWIKSTIDLINNEAHVVQFFSNRHRGRTSFTVAANGYFQGLAADAAKAALFAVSRACYTEPESPLYGSRPVLFIHDQIICEVPISMGHEAATELGRVMCEAGSKYTPDVPLTCTPCLSTCFSKDAVAIYDRHGRLVPWSPPN